MCAALSSTPSKTPLAKFGEPVVVVLCLLFALLHVRVGACLLLIVRKSSLVAQGSERRW